MTIGGFDPNRLAKVSNCAEEKTNLSPSVRTCIYIYGSKLVHFIRMRVPIYVIFNIRHTNSYLKNKHEYFNKNQREKGLANQYQLMYLYIKGKKMHMLSACSIFIINASLSKTLPATLLF